MRLWKYQEGCERLIVINQSVWWCNPIKRITLLAAWRALSIPALRNVLALTTRPPSACWWIRPLSGVSEPYDSKPPTHTHTHTHTHTNVWSHSLPIMLSEWLQSPYSLAGGKLMVTSPLLTWMSHCSTRFSSLFPIKQGCPNSVLEGRCPAVFSSNLPQHTCMEVSSMPSKTLISCFRCV